MEITRGYATDPFGQATLRYEILAETLDNRYVCRRGNWSLILRDKKDFSNVHK